MLSFDIFRISSSITLASSNLINILPFSTSIESTPSILPMNLLRASEHSSQNSFWTFNETCFIKYLLSFCACPHGLILLPSLPEGQENGSAAPTCRCPCLHKDNNFP